MKICLVGTELFRAERTDRQIDMSKLIAALSNFPKAPKNKKKKTHRNTP